MAISFLFLIPLVCAGSGTTKSGLTTISSVVCGLVIHSDDADLWRLAGDCNMETSSSMSKTLVQMKIEGREAEPSRFSSEVNGKNYGWSGMTL